MNPEISQRAHDAIYNQERKDGDGPSDRFLEFLRDLAKDGRLAEMSAAFIMFIDVHPGNANYVARRAASMVMNHYFIPRLEPQEQGIRLQEWQAANPDWAETIARSLPTNSFQRRVEFMLEGMKQHDGKAS